MLPVGFLTGPEQCMLLRGGPRGHGWYDPGQIQGAPGLAVVTLLGSVRNAKCWVGSGAIASSIDFIHAFLPQPGISRLSGFCTQRNWERKELHLCIRPGTALIPFPQYIGGWEIYPDKPRIFLITVFLLVTGNTSHGVFCM